MSRLLKPTNEMLGFIEDEDGSLRIEDIIIPPPPVATLSTEVPDKRLIITELRIKNFKSYANEVVLGPFNKNFTAVVGPNGSGKSNVIDSLLFVFGYRAKKIRSKKVSHLIHKSDQYPNVSSCSVTVKFAMITEIDEGYEIIPDTYFVLSRTAFQDDSSFYEIGKKRAPYKEVAKALRRYGIDLEHSRFLILQGEIEAISLMHPKAQNEHECGMLEYVEDIIGSNRYIQPIKQFAEKLEKLNGEKKEKLTHLRLVEKEKDDLEEPKNKAVKYLRLENQLILNENSLFHYKKFAAEQELEEILTRKKETSDKFNEIKTEINTFKVSRKTEEEQMEKISSELDGHVKTYENCQDAYKSLERKDVEMHEEIKHMKTKKSKLESTLKSTENELAKLKKQLETHEKETAELTKIKEKHEADKIVEDGKLTEVMGSMKEDTATLQEKKDKYERELFKMKKIVNDLASEKKLLSVDLKLLMETSSKETEKLHGLTSELEKTEKMANEEQILLEKEQRQIEDLQKEYPILMQKISESQLKQEAISKQLSTTRLKLEEAKASISTYANRSDVVQAFNREKAKGRFKGVLGRLGNLGAIDEKYDVAISTAAPQLDHILTDNIETAQQCIDHLKKNNLGWCTFIALDKQQHWWPYVRTKPSTPDDVPRLIDLIRTKDENVLPAFYHVLKDTLVANDIHHATRIAFQGSKRHRVVTLGGELIEMAGTMSGGGGVSRGRMGQSVVECTHTHEEVKELNEKAYTLSIDDGEIRRSILDLQQQVSETTKKLSNLKLSAKKRHSNYKSFLDSAEMLRIQVEDQKNKVQNSAVDQEKVDELKNKIIEKEKSHNESVKQASSVEEAISKLKDEILTITKGSMGKAKKTVNQLSQKISEISQSMTKSKVHAKTCKRNIEKAEQKKENAEKELLSINESKAKLTVKIDKCINEARKFLSKQDEAKAAIDELKAKKAELKKTLETLHEKEHHLKLAEITQKNAMKEHEANEAEKCSFIKSYTAKIGKLKLKEVENDSTEIPTLSLEQMERFSAKRLQSEIDLLRVQLEEIKPNLSAIGEFKKKEKLCNEKQKDFDEIVEQRNMQNKRYEALRKRRVSEFMRGFTQIAKKLKEIYQMLTLGGDAEMELVDNFDPFSEGIEFSVRPPRKSWKLMSNLSGGEKTLSSLALVFALHYYRPTPFYVMDEIDAALDVRNVAIVGYFLKERQKNTQFIIVSLRNIMNELADHLVGIYKTGNTSKNVSIMGAAKWAEEDSVPSESMGTV